jgi:hypothetical protein
MPERHGVHADFGREKKNPSLAIVSTVAFALALVGSALAREDRVPDGLTATDWSSIRAAYDANRHAAVAVEGGYQTRNSSQQWITRFDGRGFVTTPYSGTWSWGLELVNYGRDGAERAIASGASDEEQEAALSVCGDAYLKKPVSAAAQLTPASSLRKNPFEVEA